MNYISEGFIGTFRMEKFRIRLLDKRPGKGIILLFLDFTCRNDLLVWYARSFGTQSAAVLKRAKGMAKS